MTGGSGPAVRGAGLVAEMHSRAGRQVAGWLGWAQESNVMNMIKFDVFLSVLRLAKGSIYSDKQLPATRRQEALVWGISLPPIPY